MEKINILELLKDCPKGMELDSPVWDNIVFEEIDKNDIIIYRKSRDAKVHLTQYGEVNTIDGKCVIFPKGKTTWEGFVPPCQFKDGDIITDSLGTCIFKGEGEFEGTVNYYCGISNDYFRVKDDKHNPSGHYGCIVNYRLSTEEEKQKLFDAIKANGYRWDDETKTLEKLFEPKFKVGDRVQHISSYALGTIVKADDKGYYIDYPERDSVSYISFELEKDYELVPNKFDITTLKPFDKVLVRGDIEQKWTINFFGFIDNYKKFPFECLGRSVTQCIPYESNEHLLGTTNDCDEYYKNWK